MGALAHLGDSVPGHPVTQAEQSVMDELNSVRRQLLRTPGSSAGASPVSCVKAGGNLRGSREEPMSPKELCSSPPHAHAAPGVQQQDGQLYGRFEDAGKQQSSCAGSATASSGLHQDTAASASEQGARTPSHEAAAAGGVSMGAGQGPRTGPLGRKVKRMLGLQEAGAEAIVEDHVQETVQQRPLIDKVLLPKLMAQLAADVAHPSAHKPAAAVKDAQTETEDYSASLLSGASTPGSSVSSVGCANRGNTSHVRRAAGGALSPLQRLADQFNAEGDVRQQSSNMSPIVSLRKKYCSTSQCPSTQASVPPSTGPPGHSAPTPAEPQYAFERGTGSTLALLDAIEHWCVAAGKGTKWKGKPRFTSYMLPYPPAVLPAAFPMQCPYCLMLLYFADCEHAIKMMISQGMHYDAQASMGKTLLLITMGHAGL